MRLVPVTTAVMVMMLALLATAVSGCATSADAGADPTLTLQNPDVVTYTGDNGDVISEYRVSGRLQVVKVVPARGPTYYLVDRDGDGRPDDDAPVSPVLWKLFEWD